eukprot:s546_g4.t1
MNMPNESNASNAAESKVYRWPKLLRGFIALLCLVGLATAYGCRGRAANAKKVRQLKTLSDEEMKKHQIDVVSLPAFGPEFWQHQEPRFARFHGGRRRRRRGGAEEVRKELHLLERNLGYKAKLSDGSVEITRESSKDVFVRVSKCWCDVSLICLKMMAALLSLEASIHVCNLPFPEAAMVPFWFDPD